MMVLNDFVRAYVSTASLSIQSMYVYSPNSKIEKK